MKSKKIDARLILGDNPLMVSLKNPSKADIEEFIRSIGSLVKDKLETASRFNPEAKTVDVTSTTSCSFLHSYTTDK
jgi:hypothetical protein